MAQMTPPLNARGTYQLNTPWSAPAQVIYTCKAIRSFADIYDDGVDVYTAYYQPYGLTPAQFSADEAQNPNIITLIADSSDPNSLFGGSYILYVPDTFIAAYPSTDNVPYSHMALCVDLGALPDYLDLSFLETQVANVVSDTIGVVTPTLQIYTYVAPSTGTVTGTESNVLEAARLAGISNRTTDYAVNKQLTQNITLLQNQITTMTSMLGAAGLWPPQPMSTLSILQDALFKAFLLTGTGASATAGTPSAGTAPYDTKVVISGSGVLSGNLTVSYVAADIVSLQQYLVGLFNTNLQGLSFTLGGLVVNSSGVYNTTITITGVGPIAGTMSLLYNRFDLTTLLGTATVTATAAQLSTAGTPLALINSLHKLNLTAADYIVTNPTSGTYVFSPLSTSLGWTGANLTLLVQ